jgi:PadR family transcriptional regulator, regulatory protein AphA
MSLRFALLALIELGPTTGYELAKVFDQSVTHVWSAQHSQIYTELRRMEDEGLVEARPMPRGERALATKRPYAITDAGVAAFTEWVRERTPPVPLRDAAYLKATYLEYATFREAREQFREHRAHHERQRDELEAHVDLLEHRATELLERRLAASPPEAHDAIVAFKVHAYRGLIARSNAEIAWAQAGIDLVDTLSVGAELDSPVVPTAGKQDKNRSLLT